MNEENMPVKSSRLPFILAGVILLVFGLAVAFMFTGGGKEPANLLAGTSWLASNDGSQWVFREDNTFHWYQNKGQTEDNYFAGTYEFHIGQEALTYLTTDLASYGVTEKEMLEAIAREPTYTLDNFVCFSCNNQSFMLNGQEQLTEPTQSSYFGFLLQEGTHLFIANMTTGTYYSFTKE